MGEALYAAILGIVQGVTEFLPISSSAHLIVFSNVLDGKTLPLALNVALHLGTLFAVLLYFWRDWLGLAKGLVARVTGKGKNFEADVLLPALIIGSIPAAVVGLLWKDQIEAVLHKPALVALPLALVGVLLWWGDKRLSATKGMRQITIFDAFLIGIAQAFALIPGVSRSGSTILGSRLRGLERGEAARFSFLLGTPAMLGAAALEGKDIAASINQPVFYIGTVTAFVVGCLAIGFLLRFLRSNGFSVFAVYRLVIAVLIMATTQP